MVDLKIKYEPVLHLLCRPDGHLEEELCSGGDSSQNLGHVGTDNMDCPVTGSSEESRPDWGRAGGLVNNK